ncbi:MAG: cyclic nucleotide-binding domain-containing protein [Bacteroidota bacterium]
MNNKLKKIFPFLARNEWKQKAEKKKHIPSTEEILSTIPIFLNLNKGELKLVAGILHKRKYKKDEPICLQNDPGLGMYVIEHGEAEVVIIDENGDKKQLAILNDGEFFGELSLLDNSSRSASVIALKESDLLGFFQTDLMSIIKKSSSTGVKIILKIAELLGERLRQTNEQLASTDSKLKEILKTKSLQKRSKYEKIGSSK